MKKTMLISIILIFISTVLVFGNTNYQILADVVSFKITIDGIEKKTTSQVVVINGVAYLPIREVAEMLGIGVAWNGEKEEIQINTNKDKAIETENNEEEKLYPFKENKLYGYMDKEGNVIVEPIYLRGKSFSDGMAVVQKFVENAGNQYGYINTKGELAIPLQYWDAYDFNNGVAVVDLDKSSISRRVYIDKNGKQVTDREYEAAGPFSEGLGFVLVKGTIDPNVINPIQKQVWSYINTKGEYVTDKEFDRVYSFSEGYANVKVDGKWGLMDRDFNIVLDCQYEDIGDYSDGVIPVEKDEKWGVVDIKGNQIVDFKYDSVYPFSDGLANVCIGDKFGYINKEGEEIIPLQFGYPANFKHGLAPVVVGKKGNYGCINTKGEYILAPEWDEVLSIEDEDLIRVGSLVNDDSTYYIDTKGNFIGPKK